MDEKEIGRDITEVPDDELWEIVFEGAETCDTETVNAAKTELERRKNLPDSDPGETVSMNKRDRENCIQTVDEEKIGWNITEVSEDEQEIGQDIAEVPDNELREIVFEKAETCDAATINAAKAELERRKNILDLSPGKTVSMGQLISKLNRAKCIQILEKICPEEDSDPYFDLLDLCSRFTPSSDFHAKIRFQKTAEGRIKLSVVSASRTFKFSQFGYDEWIAMQIDKQDIIRLGEDTVMALCLLSMKKSSSEPQKSESGLAVCPKCGAVLEPDELFCPECGCKLPTRETMEQQPEKMNFCPECGAKLKAGRPFCANCGARVLPGNMEAEMQIPSSQHSAPCGPAKATGGLKVWLWFSIIASIITAIYCVVESNFATGMLNALGLESINSIYKVTIFCAIIAIVIDIYGDFCLLKGYKKGFYIICACTVISLIVFLILYLCAIGMLNNSTDVTGNNVASSYDGTSMISAFIIELIAATGSIGILWLFVRKQWTNFR